MHGNMVQPSARAPETPASAGRGANVAHQTRKITVRQVRVKPSSAEMPPTKAVLCCMICASTEDQRVGEKETKSGPIAGESTACGIQMKLRNSSKIYRSTTAHFPAPGRHFVSQMVPGFQPMGKVIHAVF